MKIENDFPKFYIIAETKINNQSIENGAQICEINYDKKWLNEWKKRNINISCSDIEKLLEYFYFILNNENNISTKNCLEFNKYILENELDFYNMYLKHIYVTVLFVNTSFVFLTHLNDFNGLYKSSNVNIKKINFWLPSILDNEKEIAFEIGKSLVDFVNNIEIYHRKIFEKYNNNLLKNKIDEFLDYILPKSVTYTSIVSANLYDWKEFIINKTQFNCHDEIRYILMHLLRTFKMKWPTLCDDIMLCDNNGIIYSIDSLITSNSEYQKFCVKRII